MIRSISTLILLSAFSVAQQPAPSPTPAPGSPEDLVQQGQKLSREGKQDEALALYNRALDRSPELSEAHLGAGIALETTTNVATNAGVSWPAGRARVLVRGLAASIAASARRLKAIAAERAATMATMIQVN